MGFRYTDDPIADAEAYQAELARLEEQVPRCKECDRPIPDMCCYDFGDEPICMECFEEHHKHDNGGLDYGCDICGERITEDYRYEDDCETVICHECLELYFKREVVVE